MMLFIRSILFGLVLVFALTACGRSGGSGGGDDAGSNPAVIPDSVTITVTGLRDLGGDQLALMFPDGSTQVVSQDGSITYDNSVAQNEVEEFGIAIHPSEQACVARFDEDEITEESATVNVLCGYRNEIRVVGLDEPLAADNPLIFTRDLSYYQNPGTSVSQSAVRSVFKNSTEFSPELNGEPSVSTYYSFLYGIPYRSIPS